MGRLEERVEGRKSAQAFIDLIKEDVVRLTEEGKDAFFSELFEYVGSNYKPKARKERREVVPMTDTEARVFGQQEMSFGKFQTDLICDIPLNYLDYMVGINPNFLNGDAARFLKNEKVAEQLRNQLESRD